MNLFNLIDSDKLYQVLEGAGYFVNEEACDNNSVFSIEQLNFAYENAIEMNDDLVMSNLADQMEHTYKIKKGN